MKTDYDRRMDALAAKVGKTLDGASKIEAASACAAVIAFTLKDSPEREVALMKVVKFIRQCWKTNR